MTAAVVGVAAFLVGAACGALGLAFLLARATEAYYLAQKRADHEVPPR